MNPYIEGSWDVKEAPGATAVSGTCNMNDITMSDGILIRKYLKSKCRLAEVMEQLERLDDGEFDIVMEELLKKAKAQYLTAFKNAMHYKEPPPPPEPPPCRLIKEGFDLKWAEGIKKFFKSLIFNN